MTKGEMIRRIEKNKNLIRAILRYGMDKEYVWTMDDGREYIGWVCIFQECYNRVVIQSDVMVGEEELDLRKIKNIQMWPC